VYVLLIKYYGGDEIKEDKMSGTCGVRGGEEERVQCFDG
jgi:hypothetical protein